jgi:hypothetical protein
VPPVIEASHIRIHVINPTNESTKNMVSWIDKAKSTHPYQ